MSNFVRRRNAWVLALMAGLLLAGCGKDTPTRWASAQTKKGPAVAKEAVPGGSLNKFFPAAEGDFDRVFVQEKQGTAMAELTKAGTKLATLTIFDTVSDPKVAEEYKESKEMLETYPLVAKGSMGTAILVGDRFQVQVRTLPGADFSEADRKEWIKKFNLAGLATHQ